ALTEVGSVRRALSDVERDLGQMRTSLDQHEVQEKVVESRISALEERVSSLPVAAAPPEPPARTEPAPRPKSAEKKLEKVRKSAEAPPEPRSAASALPETAPRIETGSIGTAGPTIIFGEPVVTPTRLTFAVQLAAGPSRDAIRSSWTMLREQHGAVLAPLNARIMAPRGDGPYRLLAGPLPTRAEADKVCAELGVGRQGCFATAFIGGEPL